jgi:hypothetical protein
LAFFCCSGSKISDLRFVSTASVTIVLTLCIWCTGECFFYYWPKVPRSLVAVPRVVAAVAVLSAASGCGAAACKVHTFTDDPPSFPNTRRVKQNSPVTPRSSTRAPTGKIMQQTCQRLRLPLHRRSCSSRSTRRCRTSQTRRSERRLELPHGFAALGTSESARARTHIHTRSTSCE